MKKKIFFILISLGVFVLTVIISLVIYDFKKNHGAVTFWLLKDKESYKSIITSNEFSSEKINVEYNIKRIENGDYKFNIKNNSIIPYAYYGSINQGYADEIDSTIFLFATHSYASINNEITSKNFFHYYGCGTGLGPVSFNIGETHEVVIPAKRVLGNFLNRRHYTILSDSCILDILNKQPLFCGQNLEFYEKIYNIENISKNDSLEIKFYIQLHNFITKKFYNVYSNSITFSYYDMLKNHNEIERINQERRAKYNY